MAKKQEFTFQSVLLEADMAQGVITEKQESVGQHLFLLGQAMSTPEQFEAGCEAAEAARRNVITEQCLVESLSKQGRKDRLRLPSAWSNAKSVILRGWMDHGLIPNDAETYSQYKAAKADAVKAAKTKVKGTAEKGEGQSTDDVMGNSITDVLFSDLLKKVSALPTEIQEEIALALEEIITKYLVEEVEEGDGMEELEEAQVVGAQ